MAYPTVTAAAIMDQAAVYNNDAAKSLYTYTYQIPLLNGALQELQELFELNDIPATQDESTVINCPAGTTAISFGGTPALPTDLVEPKLLWERPEGIDPYVPMTRIDFLPEQLAGVEINQFIWYVWENQKIKLLSCNQDNDIKMNYTKFLFATITVSTDNISVVNCVSYLQFRTGAMIASLLAENPSRAQELNARASEALDRALGIGTKGRQAIMTRHRPFRSGYKRGNYQ